MKSSPIGGGGRLVPARGRKRPPSAFGMNVMTGPFGSGKTLLAVHMAYPYVDRPCGGMCGDQDCDAVWRVLTNMPSVSWGEQLNAGEQLVGINRAKDSSHLVILLDEGFQYVDALTQMATAQRRITDKMMQVRHERTKVFFTSPDIDMLGRRIRAQSARIYNVWNPDQLGLTVYAQVYSGALGYLPPWKRSGMLYEGIHRWNTSASRHLYGSWGDTIDARNVMRAPAKERKRRVFDRDGKVHWMSETELVMTAVTSLAVDRRSSIAIDDIEEMVGKYGVEGIRRDFIEASCLGAGLPIEGEHVLL